jgi:hypothetical protein
MGCNQPLIPLLSSLSGSKRLARIRREDSEELVTAEDDLLKHADIQEVYKAGRSRTGEGDLQGNEPIDHGTCENSTKLRLGREYCLLLLFRSAMKSKKNYQSGSKACKISVIQPKNVADLLILSEKNVRPRNQTCQ